MNAPATPGQALATEGAAAGVPDALPFRIELQEFQGPELPAIQSHIGVMVNRTLLILGGRTAGLHTFKQPPEQNFPVTAQNNFIWVLDPIYGGPPSKFDVNSLGPSLADPLQATNQQHWYDREGDLLYVIGGYGWDSVRKRYRVFPSILRIRAGALVSAVRTGATPAQISALIEAGEDERLAVTGGTLRKLAGRFLLVFGQRFDGAYAAFGGDFQQQYTNEIRVFTLRPNSLELLSYGELTNSDPSQPFHRRDGVVVDSVDPATGEARVAAFGGVFQPGIIGGYTTPVYIAQANGQPQATVDTRVSQLFSQYECPVVVVHQSSARRVFHTFFGGIGHYWYGFSESQKKAYDLVSDEGRNDGLPFVGAVTTLVQDAAGNYQQWIVPGLIPNQRLLGASTDFVMTSDVAAAAYGKNGVIALDALPAGRNFIGVIYGGIEAQNPLPLAPNTGTSPSNSLFGVYLTRTPVAALPAAEYGHEANRNSGYTRE